MIHCSEASLLITALVDGELDLDQMDHIKAHLDMCEDCEARHRMESRLKGFLKGALANVDTPAGLSQRIRGALSNIESASDDEDLLPASDAAPSEPKPQPNGGKPSAFRLPLVILVSILTAMMATQVIVKVGSDREGVASGSPLAIELDAVHAAATGAGVFQVTSRKHATLSAWFSERLGMLVQVPDLAAVDLVPVGGRVVRVFGAPMAMVLFRDPSEPAIQAPLTIIHGNPVADGEMLAGEPSLVDGEPVRLDAMGRLTMASFDEGSRVWLLASEGTAERLLEVVRALRNRSPNG